MAINPNNQQPQTSESDAPAPPAYGDTPPSAGTQEPGADTTPSNIGTTPPSAGTTPPHAGTTPPSPGPTPEPSLWPARLSTAAGATYRWVMQPRVRLAIAGVIVALIGAGPASGTVWTLPMVIVGVLMVLVACVGHRLRGRFVIEWGESGAEIGFSASVTPAPDRPQVSPVMSAPRSQRSQLSAGTAPGVAPTATAAAANASADEDDVIEGEAHTVEIDVAELKALIAAAENAENGEGPAARDGSWREVNVHRLTSTPSPPADGTDRALRENRV